MLTNAHLYKEWIQANGLNDTGTDPLTELFAQTTNRFSTNFCFLTTADRTCAMDTIKTASQPFAPETALYYFSLLGRYQYLHRPATWIRLGGESFDDLALLEYAQTLNERSVVVIEDVAPLLRNPFVGEGILSSLRRMHQGTRSFGQTIIFVESASAICALSENVFSEFAPIRIDARLVNIPDESGLFYRGELTYFLPFLRACCVTERDDRPFWRPECWKLLEPETSGPDSRKSFSTYTRFLKSNQTLDWIKNSLSKDGSKAALALEIDRALKSWLVPIDDPLPERLEILDRRVESFYFSEKRRNRRASVWFGNREWNPRAPENFSDYMRSNVAGLDPVHTPESARAGLTRFLSMGWHIGDSGDLIPSRNSSVWGPSTTRIPNRLDDEPRRLMLGASLQTRAVTLQKDLKTWEDRPANEVDTEGWFPPGVNLRLGFSTASGLTHEDGIVLSQTASEKLRRWHTENLLVRIPSVASRVEILAEENAVIPRGASLVRAFIDLYALGWSAEAANRLAKEWNQSFQDGWIEISLRRSASPIDARVLEIKRERIHDQLSPGNPNTFYVQLLKTRRLTEETLGWREFITFVLEVSKPALQGDKVATRHGIKGVISRILPDNDPLLPKVGEENAEIVLSPIGVARRGAIGQFREVTAKDQSSRQESYLSELPRSGTAWIIRQPQDAEPRCRARGVERYSDVRGQRYGEMEFCALMAHGASKIAMELLSPGRSTAPWMYWEQKISRSLNHRKLTSRVLNRYLANLNVEIKGGALRAPAHPRCFPIPLGTHGNYRDALELLEDNMGFVKKGGLGIVELRNPIKISVGAEALTVSKVYVLPPWLRPHTPAGPHPLTKAYQKLFKAMQFSFSVRDSVAPAVRRCIALTVHKNFGVHSFLKREVLGRRLTRSARAVIVPSPDLPIDQIKIPRDVAEKIFQGLPMANRDLVLVNRNPTLHRYGLLALRPIVADSPSAVFGLPLGILKAMGADFDGDQVTIVALEGEEALCEARLLLPGATEDLRMHPFRTRSPAFTLLQELSRPEEELELASKAVGECPQEEWASGHREIVEKALQVLAQEASWPASLIDKQMRDKNSFWNRLNTWSELSDEERQEDWLALASEKMEVIYKGVRKKKLFGGVMRRQLYQRPFISKDQLFKSVAALQTVTEPLVQSVLTIKKGKGASAFSPGRFFADPASKKARESLRNLEKEFLLNSEALAEALGKSTKPCGLLGWLAAPNTDTLLRLIRSLSESDSEMSLPTDDPRTGWFLS